MKIKRNKQKQVFEVDTTWQEIGLIILAIASFIVVSLSVYHIDKLDHKKTEAPTSVKHNINS